MFCAGAALQACARSLWVLYAGQVIEGLAAGVLCAVLSVYAAEVSPAHIRGGMIVFSVTMYNAGIVSANLIDLGFKDSPAWWGALIPKVINTFSVLKLCCT